MKNLAFKACYRGWVLSKKKSSIYFQSVPPPKHHISRGVFAPENVKPQTVVNGCLLLGQNATENGEGECQHLNCRVTADHRPFTSYQHCIRRQSFTFHQSPFLTLSTMIQLFLFHRWQFVSLLAMERKNNKLRCVIFALYLLGWLFSSLRDYLIEKLPFRDQYISQRGNISPHLCNVSKENLYIVYILYIWDISVSEAIYPNIYETYPEENVNFINFLF